MSELVWNETHTTNSLHTYCYCEKDRSLLDRVVQCRGCKNWFHTKCTTIKDPPTTLFITNYQFECHNCNELNVEIFERTIAAWKDICTAALANLALESILLQIGSDSKELLESKNEALMEQWQPEQYYFNKKDLIPFIDKHWDSLCTERSRTPTWWATLGSCLYSSKDVFVARDESERSASSDFRLADSNLWHIRPHPGGLIPRLSNKRKELSPEANGSMTPTTPSPRSYSPAPLTPSTVPTVFPQGASANTDHPFNRFGFKYSPCEPSILPLIAYRQAENSLGGCTISIPDKSSYVSVTKDGLTVTTDKGFRMCRANVGVKEGNWFWEARIQNAAGPASEGAHVRIGFARREACLNAPVGYDAYGYAYRDKTGDKMFCSRPEKYGEPFQSGDVIGLYISIPPKNKAKFQSALRRRIPIAYKERFWFEEKDYRPSKEMEALADPYRKEKEDDYEPKKLHGSFITVYKNGVNQGIMFTDLIDYEDFGRLPETIQAKRAKKKRKQSKKDHGSNAIKDDFDSVAQHWTDDPPVEDDGTLGYYPAVSVFKGGVVNCNFGPHFQYPPTDQKDWKPLSERYNEYMVEECVWDLVDEVSRSFRHKKN
ncbi:transcription factor, contains a PHD finger motif [Mucor circinelloides]